MRRSKKNRLIVAAPTGGEPQLARLPQSRIKLVASIVGILLALAPAPWAAMKYEESQARSGTRHAGASESFEIVPGSSTSTRNEAEQPSATRTQDGGLSLDLGELQAGTSRVYADLLRLQNTSKAPLVVHVEPVGLSEAPMHASVSGTQSPGIYEIQPGASVPVDLGIAADILAPEGDVAGALHIASASGRIEQTIPAVLSIRPPPQESVIAELLGPTSNPNAGLGVLNDLTIGLEKPSFEIDGILDGGLYSTDVRFSWKPVGPLTRVRATFDGVQIGQSALVTAEGDHRLVVEGFVLGSVPFAKTVSFRIDKSPPNVFLVTSETQVAGAASFAASVSDASRVAGVDFVARRLPEAEQRSQQGGGSSGPGAGSEGASGGEPDSAESPEQTQPPYSNQYRDPEESPAASGADSGSESSSPKPSATPKPTPKPSSSPKPSASPKPAPSPSSKPSSAEQQQKADPYAPVRYQARYDESTGLWQATVDLQPGTYEVYAYAVDQLGNNRESARQHVEAVSPVHSGLHAAQN